MSETTKKSAIALEIEKMKVDEKAAENKTNARKELATQAAPYFKLKYKAARDAEAEAEDHKDGGLGSVMLDEASAVKTAVMNTSKNFADVNAEPTAAIVEKFIADHELYTGKNKSDKAKSDKMVATWAKMDKTEKDLRTNLYKAMVSYNKAATKLEANSLVAVRKSEMEKHVDDDTTNFVVTTLMTRKENPLDFNAVADYFISIAGAKKTTSGDRTRRAKVWDFKLPSGVIETSESDHSGTLVAILNANNIGSFETEEMSFDGKGFQNKKYVKDGKELTYTADPRTRCRQITKGTKETFGTEFKIEASDRYKD
jgi:hypothetical protein